MVQKPIIAANWKMYKTASEAVEFIKHLLPHFQSSHKVQAYLAVPFTAIATLKQECQKVKAVHIGAQNMHDATEGAFTGEIAASMLVDAGADFVVLGHSERRQLFSESDEFINRKVIRALDSSLQVILCVGETKEEHNAGLTSDTVKRQLTQSLNGVHAKNIEEKLIIAYEPVWAIGTGLAASADQIQKAHLSCREVLKELFGEKSAFEMAILYGGSVKPDNIASFLKEEGVDGALIGGSSLNPENYLSMLQTAEETISSSK